MNAGKPIAFVMIAFLIGGAASQLPFAFADSSSNPLQALWDAIGALDNRQEDLQAQIDELRESIENDNVALAADLPSSEPSISLELENSEQPDTTTITVRASNSGPDSAVGVKLTVFYEMPLLDVESISEEQCEKLSRGIIECYIGTIEVNGQYPITIVSNAKVIGEESVIVADISSITKDIDPSNNHAELEFVTGDSRGLNPESLPDETEPETNDEEQGSEESSIEDDEIVNENTSNNATSQDVPENSTNETQTNEPEQAEEDGTADSEEQESESDQQDQGTDDASNAQDQDEVEDSESAESSSDDGTSEGEDESSGNEDAPSDG